MTLTSRVGSAAAVALIALVAARAAMLPGLGFWDTAELQAVAPLMGTGHPAGFPTYVLLGWLASVLLQPFGEPAFRMNLFAGLCLAAAAGITVDLARALTRSTLLGILAGLGLALTPIAWSIGTHAETHALHLALVALLLRLLVAWETRARAGANADAGASRSADRYLIAAAIVFGLSVGNHSLTLLLVAPIALFVLSVDRELRHNQRLVGLCVGALVASVAVVYLELPLRAGPFRAPLVYGRPETWDGFWYVVLGEQFRGGFVNAFADLPRLIGSLADRGVAQLGILAPLIPVAFAATIGRHPRYALLTGSAVLITVLFAVSYENADIGRYYLGPALMVWTWLAILAGQIAELIGLAFTTLIGRGSASRQGNMTAGSRMGGPPALVAAGLMVVLIAPTALALPTRFAAVDMSWDQGAAGWVDRALTVIEPRAVVVSWWSYSTPLWYAQRVEGRRPDLRIIDDRTRLDEGLGDITDVIDAHLGRIPVYVIRDDPAEIEMLAERYELEYLEGPSARWLTRVVARRAITA